MKKTAPAEEMTFEQAMARLEEIVADLDRGDLALEEALKLFQEGTALREICERKLAEAEATVEELLQHTTAQPTPAAAPTDAAAEPAGGGTPPAAPATVENLFGDDDAS